MSDSGKAVFLSYASQDAEAAQRICDALRAAGVEVWFDQNELVGGDAWDQKIRRQIKECALLIPVISANTQARAEGYFRLEWRLADQRTHLMGKSKAFLLPVTIDGTTDADADVPDSFVAVQWTKAPGGAVPPAFLARVQQLLRGAAAPGSGSRPPAPVASNSPWAPAPRRRWLPWVIAGVILAGVGLAWMLRSPSSRGTPALSASGSEARRLVEEASALVTRMPQTPERFRAARALAERAAALDPLDGEVLARSALIDLSAYETRVEVGDDLREGIRAKLGKAKGLAPASPWVRLAEAKAFVRLDPTPVSLEAAAELLRDLPADPRQARGLLGIVRQEQGRYAEAVAALEEAGWLNAAVWAALSGGDLTRAEALARRQREADPVDGASLSAVVAMGRGDLDAMRAALDQVPVASRLDEMVVSVRVWLYVLRRDAAGLEEAARALPAEFVTNGFISTTRGELLAFAARWRGHPDAAREEAERALREIERLRGVHPDDLGLRFHRLFLLRELDRREELSREVEALRQRSLPDWQGEAVVDLLLALDRKEEALALLEKQMRAGGPRLWFQHARARFAESFDPLRGDPRFERLLRETRLEGAKPFDEPKHEVKP